MQKNKRAITAKVVIVGSVGVGKSSVSIRYVYERFDLKQQSTLGAAYMEKLVPFVGEFKGGKRKISENNKQNKQEDNIKSFQSEGANFLTNKMVNLQIWDTAGQQKYRAIAKLYYKDCRAAILVYDVTKRQSFQDLKKWYQQLQKNAPINTKYFVVGNKIDLLQFIIHEKDNTVSFSEGKQYSKSIHAQFFQVSAKDNTGIFQLFQSVANILGPIIHKQRNGLNKSSFLQDSSTTDKKKCCGSQ